MWAIRCMGHDLQSDIDYELGPNNQKVGQSILSAIGDLMPQGPSGPHWGPGWSSRSPIVISDSESDGEQEMVTQGPPPRPANRPRPRNNVAHYIGNGIPRQGRKMEAGENTRRVCMVRPSRQNLSEEQRDQIRPLGFYREGKKNTLSLIFISLHPNIRNQSKLLDTFKTHCIMHL